MAQEEKTRILAGEVAAVRGELARVDAKCSTLVALAGAGLAFTLTAISGKDVPTAAKVLLAGAALMLAASALVLLFKALRPRLGPTGFNRWAQMSRDQVRDEVWRGPHEEYHHAEELVVLSRIAAGKFTAIRHGVHLLAAGLVLVAAAICAQVIA
ncbi:Pycsar system effector family protein [Actinocorallia aurantiaca]|uniref:Pycsar effector protein domain-containing protein n=1 Tax=Actinocorallia aurantiaca TaxID=46204 RepID=A0ABN3UAG2_9ACTN